MERSDGSDWQGSHKARRMNNEVRARQLRGPGVQRFGPQNVIVLMTAEYLSKTFASVWKL